MLQVAPLASNPSARSFLEIWIDRYRLDALPPLSSCSAEDLISAISREGRLKTAQKVERKLRAGSEFAAIQTNDLFTYVPNVINLDEARRIASFVEKIYAKVIDAYKTQKISPAWLALVSTVNQSTNVLDLWEKAGALTLLSIEQMARDVEPLILALQEQHLDCSDRRTIGFMSTQFHFSTGVLLSSLSPIEQLLLKPYLRFVEEQVCIPWQRICTVAGQYPLGSPVLAAVKSMLQKSAEIERMTYKEMLSRFPMHHSRRGLLNRPEVAASSTRDINMFQAYIALCVLEDSLSSVESELLPLCMMVFPSIQVEWMLVETGVNAIVDAVQSVLAPDSAVLIKPYALGVQSLFAEARNHPLFLEISQAA